MSTKDFSHRDRIFAQKGSLFFLVFLILLINTCFGTDSRQNWCTLYGDAPPPSIDTLIAARYEVAISGRVSTVNTVKGLNPRMKWMFYNSVSDNYISGSGVDEHGFLLSECQSRGADPESLYYHYWDDTVIELQGQQIFIPGWGGGFAPDESAARVPVYYADLSRRAVNLNNQFTRQLEKEYNLEKFKTLPEGSQVGYYDGIFLDNSTHRFYNYGSVLSGGKIAEHPAHAKVTEEEFQSWYWEGLKRFLQELKDTLAYGHTWSPDGKDKFSCINICRSWIDEYATDEVADMLLMEFQYSPVKNAESMNTLAEAYRRDSLSAVNGVCQLYSPSVVTELSGYSGHYTWGEALLGNLAYFYISRSDSAYLYIDFNFSYSPSYPGWDTLTWHECMDYVLGEPVENRYRIIKSGVDGRGYEYKVYSRWYRRALVLCRPRGGWNEHFDEKTRVRVDLPTNFRALLPNGNLGPLGRRVHLRNGEAAILIPAAFGSYIEGEVWGIWAEAGSPYNVIGEVRVPSESTLVIEPGVKVNFQGHYRFVVDSSATLLAMGTDSSSIHFTADDTATGWHGIRFLSADSDSRIRYCRLEYGKATGTGEDAKGGAIYCFHSSPTISDNTISRNSAYLGGGGIHCDYSSPVISNNIIRDNNSTAAGGGGINCWESGPTISGNSISSNSAASYGGGIHCGGNSNPTIIGSTIAGNSADGGGGGIYCNESDLTITNTILWENRAPVGPEIYLFGGGSPIVTYCDVQGGWEGEGNLDADPIFVGRERDDFHLRWHSPCIDAGDPSLTDPDGTRSEIGALHFNQAVLGIVELYPHNTPIVIPPEGGDIIYDGWVFNFSGQPGEADLWTYVFIPEIGRYGPINLCQNVSIPPDGLGVNGIVQHVPGSAPEGTYGFVAYIGSYPGIITDISYFYFTKTGSTAGGTKGWFEGRGWFKEVASTETDLPRAYALSQNYPNPFNITTVINYQLPTDSHVKLEVYNTLGRKVVTLVSEKQQAGYKSVIWDSADLSSGLYLYKLIAGDFAKRKIMTLVK